MFSSECGSMVWKGPYEVVKVLFNHYVVQDNNGKQKPRKVHINQMRVYEGQKESTFPLWVEGKGMEEVQVMENLASQQKPTKVSPYPLSRSVREASSKNLKEAQYTQKEHSDTKARPRIFQLGDKVLLLKAERSRKLEVDWEEPFKIVQVLLFDNYLIQRVGTKEKPIAVHADRLKPYQEN